MTIHANAPRPLDAAPGAPGIDARWTSSAKNGVGTALSVASPVWFTLSHGILNEVYYPRVDSACTRDFGLIVTDAQGYFSEEKRDCDTETVPVAPGIPAFRVTNTARDGRYRITLTGISRFRLKEAVAGFAPYVSGEVSWDGFGRDRGQPEKDAGFHRKEFMALLQRYFSSRNLATDWESLQGADDELLINSLSMLCPFAAEDRQALLEAPSLQTRRETLITLMEFALHSGGEDPMQ